SLSYIFVLPIPQPPRSTLVPYTTLFRSLWPISEPQKWPDYLFCIYPFGLAKVRKFFKKQKIFFLNSRPHTGATVPSLVEWCKGRNFILTLQQFRHLFPNKKHNGLEV